MTKTRVGVVGAGFSGSAHLRALRQLPQVEVAAVADQSVEQARAAAERSGVAHSFAGHEQMLREIPLDAVHNCTPNQAHAEVTMAALKQGVHVLSEKPLGMSAPETRSLVNAAADASVVAGVCFNYRFYPLIREIRATLQSGDVGRPHLVHGSYLQDWLLLEADWNWRLESEKSGASRAFADIGSHWLDLVQFVTGDAVVEVVAQLGTLHERRLRPSRQVTTFASTGQAEGERIRIDTEDFACVLLTFAGGCRGALTVSQVSAGRKNALAFEIDTREAAFHWNQEEPNTLWIGRRGEANRLLVRDPSLMSTEGSVLARLPGGHPEGWLDTLVNLFADFYGAIAARDAGEVYQPSFATFAEAHRIEETVGAVLASNRLGRAVKVGAPE